MSPCHNIFNPTELVKDDRYMNINPEYQREVVWTEQRMIHLIDSLFNNYYVPPLIFKVMSGVKEGTNERRKWRTCIDGKQRLTTIRKFFDGEIPYVDKKRNRWYYRDPSNSTTKTSKRVLSDEQKEFIDNVQIVNIEFEFLDPEQEEDMFQRVQLGVPLTTAEKLAALTGGLPSFINDLRSAYRNIPALITAKRSIDFRLIASLVYLMYNRQEEEHDLKLSNSQTKLKKFLEDRDFHRVLTPAFRAHCRRVFGKYNDLIGTYPDTFTHTFGTRTAPMKKFSPVEFLGVGILLDVYPERPNRVVAEDINAFRKYMRERLHDLRTNTPTWLHVMDFVGRLEDTRGYFPPENESHANKRQRATNGVPVSPKRSPAFNPPAPNRQLHSTQSTVYNELQRRAMQERMALLQQEQRQAFSTLPPPRAPRADGFQAPVEPSTHAANPRGGVPRAPEYAAGVQEAANGARKRQRDGVPVKREGYY